MLTLRTTVAQSVSEIDDLAPLWNEIVSTREPGIFQRFTWNRLAADVFADRLQPRVVAIEGDDGAAILPLALNRFTRRLELLGESLFDYRDVLHVGNPEALRLAWQRASQFAMPLSVTAIRAAAAQEHWREFPLTPFASAPGVRREMIGEQRFRAAHLRLDRHFRRIQKRGVTLRVHTGDNSDLVRELYHRKCDQFSADENNIFRDPRRRQFMVDIAAIEGKACEIFTLQDEDEILVAGLVTFREAEWRRFYTIYFDPGWASYSPGILLVYEATARSLAEQLNCDYMTGEYPYKLRFANASHALYTIDITAEQLAEVTKRPVVPSAV